MVSTTPFTPAAELSDPDGTVTGMDDIDRRILGFERQWWKYAGAKEQAIAAEFDLNATTYYQRLNALIDTAEAEAHDPVLVKRLRKLRASRARQRTARRPQIAV
jgi:hypothetical protein